MKQCKAVVCAIAITACFITLVMYYCCPFSLSNKDFILARSQEDSQPQPHHRETTPLFSVKRPLKRRNADNVDLLYQYSTEHESSNHEIVYSSGLMLNTTGCQIPANNAPYPDFLKTDRSQKLRSCGKRAVILKKINGKQVKATINKNVLKTYATNGVRFYCCYRFVTNQRWHKPAKTLYTKCKTFQDHATITLEYEFINIKCYEVQKVKSVNQIYDDVYAFTKMLKKTVIGQEKCKEKYNVILLGMGSMSLQRFEQIMTTTNSFLNKNQWLSYKGYHKITDYRLPNLMAIFTGLNMTTLAKRCTGKIMQCKDLFLWKIFKDNGYFTAYGEDNLRLPDAFQDSYQFNDPPTDHHMKPFFVKFEAELFNNSLACAGKMPPARHILEYAYDFAWTYKTQSFFGFFWINSYSNNPNSHPQDVDDAIINFLKSLEESRILKKTFVIFFSDHFGLRFGDNQMLSNAQYDESLPFLFVWSPVTFNLKYVSFHESMRINQNRLTTPYDLYCTLTDIYRLSLCTESYERKPEIRAEGCPKCHGLFTAISDNRTCDAAGVDEKWCSCHELHDLDFNNKETLESIDLIEMDINERSKLAITKSGWICANLSVQTVIRAHYYKDIKTMHLYHIIALCVTPGNACYEGTVVLPEARTSMLVGPIRLITPYNGLGSCATAGRYYCVCQRSEY